MTASNKRKWLFHSGMQYADWVAEECGNCVFYVPDYEPGQGCPIEEAVGLAYLVGDEEELVENGLYAYHPYTCKRKVASQ